MEAKPKFILDTDPGIDDTQALFIALKHFDLKAITTVAGNSTLDNLTTNAARCLELCETEVPIYPGAAKPLVKPLHSGAYFHGEDGIGDHPDHKEWKGYQQCIKEDESGAEAIVRLCKEHEGDISLLCIAPLTNIALALAIDPDLPKRVKEIFIMGGTLHGKGNYSFNLEFNFACDPHAAHNVLKAFPLLHIIPWEACHEYTITKEETEELFDKAHPRTDFYGKINEVNYK